MNIGRRAAAVALVMLTGACRDATPSNTAPTTATTGASVEVLHATVVATQARDPSGFTQGLELDGAIRYESNGIYGRSSVQAIDNVTGQVRRTFHPPATVFVEGVTKVGDHLVVLTWRERVAYLLDAATLTEAATLPYDADGWGICARDGEVVTSDGSDTLTVRDPASLAPRRRVHVRLDGRAVHELNELECVGDDVWANVWRTDRIVRIRLSDGSVTGVADVPELRPPATRADAEAVLNGIAHVDATGTFLLTGKRWPVIHEVRFTSTDPEPPR